MLTHGLRMAIKPLFISVSSFDRTTSSTTIPIDRPTGVLENDFLIVFLQSQNNGVNWTYPAGWVESFDNGTGFAIAYKNATASEATSYTFTQSSSSPSRGCILCYRGAKYDTVGTSDTVSPFTPTGITMSNFGFLLGAIGRGGSSGQTATLPASMTSRFNSGTSTPYTLAVGEEAIQLGATGTTRTFTITNNNNINSILVGIKTG